jgi:hypothetical protein
MTNQTTIVTKLKELQSEDAATLLMKTFPAEAQDYSEAFKIMAHRSWKRSDQIRLARFYLKKMPFANAKPYEIFASFMSLATLIGVVKESLPSKLNDRQFIAYHVAPVLKKNIRTETDRAAVDKFLTELVEDSVLPHATSIPDHF